MQRLNQEYTMTVLQMLREGKTEKQISLETKKHRNTVSRYINYLRTQNAYDHKQLINEIITELHTRIPDMEDRDLIQFLARLMPQTIFQQNEQVGKIVVEIVDPPNPKSPDPIQTP